MKSVNKEDPDGLTTTALRPSRRQFLKGMGLAGAAAVVSPELGYGDTSRADADLQELGHNPQEIALNINGETKRVTVEPRTTLLETLRDRLDLTGSKEICDRGACGGCTVLCEGKAVASCMMLAMDAVDLEIVTVEGIAKDPKYENLIDAYCECDAAQCGYCIPGFVVRSAELLAESPEATREQIQDGLSGNICRCGTYYKIFDAVELAIERGGLK